MKDKKPKKTARRIVIMEPALISILEAQSEALGCQGVRRRSISDILRRSAKTIILHRAPNLKNIEDVDWSEVYTSYNI